MSPKWNSHFIDIIDLISMHFWHGQFWHIWWIAIPAFHHLYLSTLILWTLFIHYVYILYIYFFIYKTISCKNAFMLMQLFPKNVPKSISKFKMAYIFEVYKLSLSIFIKMLINIIGQSIYSFVTNISWQIFMHFINSQFIFS